MIKFERKFRSNTWCIDQIKIYIFILGRSITLEAIGNPGVINEGVILENMLRKSTTQYSLKNHQTIKKKKINGKIKQRY